MAPFMEPKIAKAAQRDMMKAKNKGGRPPYSPTELDKGIVLGMVIAGATQRQIAARLQISLMTLEKYYRHEIDFGKSSANAAVVENLYRQATKDDPRAVTAAIFWCKTQLGWRETIHHTGEVGSALDLSSLSPEILAELKRTALQQVQRTVDAVTYQEQVDES